MQQPSTNGENDKPSPLFPDTLWSVVLDAKASNPETAQAALTELCKIYRKPIVTWLRIKRNKENAEDLASAFILRFHERNHLVNFKQKEKVKFRSFLLKCLKRFVKDEKAKAEAGKRNKGVAPVPLDDHDAPHEPNIAGELDQAIASTIHERVIESLSRQNRNHFDELRQFLFGLDRSVSYAQAASRLGISEGAVKAAVPRLRESYYDAFCAEVAQIAPPAELDEETRYLLGLISKTE